MKKLKIFESQVSDKDSEYTKKVREANNAYEGIFANIDIDFNYLKDNDKTIAEIRTFLNNTYDVNDEKILNYINDKKL